MLSRIFYLLLLGAGVLSDDENPCGGAGVYPDPSDNASFLICSEIGDSLDVTKVVRCPANYTFSEVERTCVQEQKIPHLRVTRATSNMCKVPGPVCATCDLLVVCAEMEGKVLPLVNVSCSETSPSSPENICDAKIKGCKPPNSDSKCRPAPASSSFRCIQPGFYPDPTDCKKYHVCDDALVHYEDSCDVRYDPLLATCQDDAACTGAEAASATCSSDSRPKAVPSSPGFYSVCIPAVGRTPKGEFTVNYQTAILQCPESKQFNNDKSSCELACKKRPDHIPDPEDCHSYYDCPLPKESTDPPVKRTCSPGLGFDGTKKICALESKVPSCRARSLTTREVNERPSAITTTAVPTQTTQRSSSTSSTTTTKPSGQCAEQSFIQDSTSCYRYYQCSRGRLQRRQCPLFSYFHPSYGRCIFGFFCQLF